jgi:glycosyltransferase involved in cell wall biosynthesis
MKFSIVICTYNASKSLPTALDLILAQKCADYEVIIIDGSSIDGTQEIIKGYEKKFDGRLRWISELDKGIYDAMNKGIDMARGEWIYFLGSDDVLCSNDVLEKISNEIGESNPDVIYGNVAWGNTGKIYDGKFSALKLMQENICHQSIFFKKRLFDKFGKYDTKYKVLADHIFNMQWFNDESVRRKYVDLTIAKYNVDGQSSVSCAPDEEFTKDRDKIIGKYFPKEYVDLIGKLEQNEKLQRLELELDVMRSSKFWKMRNFYTRIKSLFSSKNQS